MIQDTAEIVRLLNAFNPGFYLGVIVGLFLGFVVGFIVAFLVARFFYKKDLANKEIKELKDEISKLEALKIDIEKHYQSKINQMAQIVDNQANEQAKNLQKLQEDYEQLYRRYNDFISNKTADK